MYAFCCFITLDSIIRELSTIRLRIWKRYIFHHPELEVWIHVVYILPWRNTPLRTPIENQTTIWKLTLNEIYIYSVDRYWRFWWCTSKWSIRSRLSNVVTINYHQMLLTVLKTFHGNLLLIGATGVIFTKIISCDDL